MSSDNHIDSPHPAHTPLSPHKIQNNSRNALPPIIRPPSHDLAARLAASGSENQRTSRPTKRNPFSNLTTEFSFTAPQSSRVNSSFRVYTPEVSKRQKLYHTSNNDNIHHYIPNSSPIHSTPAKPRSNGKRKLHPLDETNATPPSSISPSPSSTTFPITSPPSQSLPPPLNFQQTMDSVRTLIRTLATPSASQPALSTEQKLGIILKLARDLSLHLDDLLYELCRQPTQVERKQWTDDYSARYYISRASVVSGSACSSAEYIVLIKNFCGDLNREVMRVEREMRTSDLS